MVVRRGMALALLGVGIGWLATLGVSRLLASLLFQVETLDAPNYLGASVVLVLVAFAATLLPAMRAAPHRASDRAPVVSRFSGDTLTG